MTFSHNRKRRILLDMDNCIADFGALYEQRFNIGPEQFLNGIFVGGNDEFWRIFNTNPTNFFREIPPFAGTKDFVEEVLKLADHYGYTVEVLTAIPKKSTYPTAEREKREWMMSQRFSKHIPVNIGPYAENKCNHAKPQDILIDDNTKNIEQWIAKGNAGILHVNFEESIAELKKILVAQSGNEAIGFYR